MRVVKPPLIRVILFYNISVFFCFLFFLGRVNHVIVKCRTDKTPYRLHHTTNRSYDYIIYIMGRLLSKSNQIKQAAFIEDLSTVRGPYMVVCGSVVDQSIPYLFLYFCFFFSASHIMIYLQAYVVASSG